MMVILQKKFHRLTDKGGEDTVESIFAPSLCLCVNQFVVDNLSCTYLTGIVSKVRKTLFFGILFKHFLLVYNAVTVSIQFIIS